MRTGGLTSLYDRLSADERFRLTLAALARDDENELRRLEDSCPRHTYSMADAAVGGRVHDSRDCALFFTIVFQRVLRSVELALSDLRAVDAFTDGYTQGVHAMLGLLKPSLARDTVAEPPDPDDEEDDLPHAPLRTRLQGDYLDWVAALKGLYEGFERFCGEATLDPNELLAWSPLGREAVESAQTHLMQEVVADEHWAEETRRALSAHWPKLATSRPGDG